MPRTIGVYPVASVRVLFRDKEIGAFRLVVVYILYVGIQDKRPFLEIEAPVNPNIQLMERGCPFAIKTRVIEIRLLLGIPRYDQ